jgi:predicted RNase H-like HicB family nuclease
MDFCEAPRISQMMSEMNYPAVVTQEGPEMLISFPDCPGCQAFASVNENALKLAQDALAGWLEVGIKDGKPPPRPSGKVKLSDNERLLMVPVPDTLAKALEAEWSSR